MKLTNIVFSLAVGLGALSANASTLYFDSVDGTKDSSGNYVSPYYGRLDTNSYKLFCDDFDHNIGIPDTETVNVSTISNLSQTRFGGVTNATTKYEEIFYLSSYLLTANATDRGNIQDAIWSYFASDAPNQNSTAVKGWETQAASNYAGKDYSSFRILTDASNQYGGKQELFISVSPVTSGLTGTPEPGTWAMLLSGFGGLALVRRRRTQA